VAPGSDVILPPLHPAWSAALDGAAVYGQPLLAGGRVLVATEDDHVYALDPADGAVVWTVDLGAPLRNVIANTGCGDVDPLGVTSTPVADPTTDTLYVVGEISTGGEPPVHHVMAAVDIATGRLLETVDVDPPLPSRENAVHLLQRAALALGNGRVYVGYGGQYGDCGTYHGWIVSVPVVGRAIGAAARPAETAFDVTPESTGGAVWDGGDGPSIGPDGSVYTTTGNPNSGGPSPWAEAVLKLAPALGPTPEAVYQDHAATGDEDLATGGAEVLPNGSVFAAGKTDIGYVLRQSDLSPLAPVHGAVCDSDPDGGAAYDAGLNSLYLPCNGGGLQQVDLATDAVGWKGGSVDSTPILVDGHLWALSYSSGTIEELDPATGKVMYRTAVGRSVPHFAALSAVDGLLLVPTQSGIAALTGASGRPAAGPG
jgi:outer membrane protein assembly factor BamB